MIVFNVGLGEVVSLLQRKHNRGQMSAAALAIALADFLRELALSPDLQKLTATDQIVAHSFHLITTHSLNSNDAIILRLGLDRVAELRATGHDLFLAASDQRLLRAAQAEGLATFDPETQTSADLDAILGP